MGTSNLSIIYLILFSNLNHSTSLALVKVWSFADKGAMMGLTPSAGYWVTTAASASDDYYFGSGDLFSVVIGGVKFVSLGCSAIISFSIY